MLKITSRDNQRIKHARKVYQNQVKDAILIEGVRLAEEALRSNLKIEDVLVTTAFFQSERGQNFISRIQTKTHSVAEIPERILQSISDMKTAPGVMIIARRPKTGARLIKQRIVEKARTCPPLIVLLHQINNPANLGAILRTAEAVDVSGVITTNGSADIFAPKSLRAAMGAVFRTPIWTNADFHEALSWARENNLLSVSADVNADKSYLDIDWRTPRLLVFGSEAHGLSAGERDEIDESLIIPMDNEVESLNLAVSCGIILFEAKRQNR